MGNLLKTFSKLYPIMDCDKSKVSESSEQCFDWSEWEAKLRSLLVKDSPSRSSEIADLINTGAQHNKDDCSEFLAKNDDILLEVVKQNLSDAFEALSENDLMNGINRVDNQGLTALHFAVRNQNLKIVNLLLARYDCDADVRDNLLDQSPPHELFSGWLRTRRLQDENTTKSATKSEDVFEALSLILPRCDPNALCRTTKESILHRLASRSDPLATSVLEWLLNSYSDVLEINLQNGLGESPLMVAVETGNLKNAKLFLQSGSDLFYHNKFRETALHI